MKSAKLVAPCRIELFDEVFDFQAGEKEAVVEVKAVGICGTDIHIFKGERKDVKLPRVMGHELSGVVKQVGAGAVKVKPGDRVVLDPVFACGNCPVCLSGHPNVCGDVKCFGVQMDGGFQQFIKVPEDCLYRFSPEISFSLAALAEPFSIAANIMERAQVSFDDKVLIFGAGTIGLAVLQAAKSAGAFVMISDLVEEKLKNARDFGADAVVRSGNQELAQAVKEQIPGGPSVIIDAVGMANLLEASIAVAAPAARIVVIGFDETKALVSPVSITKRELTVLGSRMNCHQFGKVIDWLEAGKIRPQAMITKEFPLEKIQEAFEYTVSHSDECIKTIITI